MVLIRLKFNPRQQRMVCAKFGWYRLSASVEDDFLNFVNVFSQFHYNFTLEEGVALYLNKLESPSSKDALCQIWLKLAYPFRTNRFFNFDNVFLLFCNFFPLKMGILYFNILKSPFPKYALCQVWLKSTQWFWKRRWKSGKFTDWRTDRRTTDNQLSVQVS